MARQARTAAVARSSSTATWSPMLVSAGLVVVVVTLLQQPAGVFGAAPSTDEDCAGLVSVEEVARGKGAFLSGCSTLSESYLGGCWTQEVAGDFVEESTGCQTCIIQETAFSGAVFPVVFPEELDPCPDSLDYTAFYEDLYGASLSVVTAASLTSTGCPEGWLYSKDTGNCYLKSPNTAKAENQAHASTICEAEDAWLIAINSEAENDFLLHNLLFSGFFGETYTGMTKDSPSAEWVWPAESSSTAYDCLGDYSNWIEGPEIGCDSDFGDGADGSCMEIFPYEPKGWNPFSCAVGKHYVCEKPSTEAGTGTTPATTPGPTPASVAATPTPTPSTTPVSAPTPAPAAAAAAPTSQPSTSATVEPTVKAETAAPTAEATQTSAPEAAATVEPTIATVEPTMAGAPVGDGVTPAPAAAAGPAATATTAPTALPSGADDDPSEDDGDEDGDLAPTPPSTSPPSSASPPPSASPPSPVAPSTSAPTLPRSWAGSNLVSLTLAGVWTDATYSLYLKEGDSQTAVATDLTKDALGTSTHTYYVKDGCYGLEVASTGDPTELTWTVAGGQAFQNGGVTTGQGLDGCRFTVGGGVCDARECQAQCLSDLFATADGDAEMSATSSCDGYAALISGACGDVCPGDDGTGLDVQQNCVRAGCDAEMVCGLDFEEGGDGLDLTFQVEIKALLEAPVATTTSGAVSGSEGWDPDTEFGTAVASWLRVEPEDVVVTAVDGVGVEETSAEGADSQTQEDGDDQGMGYRQRRLDPSTRPAEPIQRRALQTDSSAPSSSSSSSSASSTGTSGTGATKFTRYRARIYPTNSSWEEASGLEGTADAAESGGELEEWLREGGGSWAGAWVTSVEGEVVEELSVVSGTSEYPTDSQSSSEGSSDDALLIGGITAAAVVLLGLALMAFCRARKKSASRKSVTRDFLGGAEQGYASPGSSSSRRSHQRRQSGGIGTSGGEKFQRLNDDEESFPYGGGKDSSASAVGPGGRNSGGGGGGNGAQKQGGPAVKGAAARVFVPVDLGQEDAVSEGAGGPPSAAAAATSSGQSKPASTKASIPAASVAHKRRQQQRQQEHGRQQQQRSLGGAGFSADELSASEDGSGSGSGSGSGGGSSGGRSANAAGGARRNGPRPGRLDSQCSEAASTAFPSVYGVGAQGSAKTAAVEEDEAASDQDQFSATPTSSIAASSTGTLHHKRTSSKIAFVANGTEVKDTETLNTKQPTIRGPSGALASLGFARGRSLDSFDEGSAGGYGSADGGGSGSLYDGGSEAGSRYHGQGGSGPVMGSGGRMEGGSMQLYPTAEARILEMKDRQKNAKPVTRLTSFDMTLPSPGPYSPSTDWDLAQGIAPSPGGEGFHDIRSRGSSRRRGARMSSQSSVDMADRQFSRVASKNGRSSSSPSSKQSAGGEGSGVGGVGDALSASGRSSRPPISRSGSRIGTPGRRGATGGARSGGRRGGGGGGGEDNSGGGHASSREGGRGGGSVPIGRGVSGGRGAGDSDCEGFIGDTVDAGGRGAERQQQQGRREGARKAGGGDPQNPHDDSDGESMFYGRSSSASGSAEGMLLPAARKAGASRASDGAKGMLPPPSPLAY